MRPAASPGDAQAQHCAVTAAAHARCAFRLGSGVQRIAQQQRL
jgi:hypothetical protein